MFVSMDQTEHLGSVHFTICKLKLIFLNEKKVSLTIIGFGKYAAIRSMFLKSVC